MDKNVENVISFLEEKYGEDVYSFFPKEKVVEIAISCVSLICTFLSNSNEKQSLEIGLFNKDGVLAETLHGVTSDNIFNTISDILITKTKNYSKISLNSFSYVDGIKKVKNIGEIEIS